MVKEIAEKIVDKTVYDDCLHITTATQTPHNA
jgi:hypothetical protein